MRYFMKLAMFHTFSFLALFSPLHFVAVFSSPAFSFLAFPASPFRPSVCYLLPTLGLFPSILGLLHLFVLDIEEAWGRPTHTKRECLHNNSVILALHAVIQYVRVKRMVLVSCGFLSVIQPFDNCTYRYAWHASFLSCRWPIVGLLHSVNYMLYPWQSTPFSGAGFRRRFFVPYAFGVKIYVAENKHGWKRRIGDECLNL